MASPKPPPITVSNTTFGKLVRAYREQRGWTQTDLAVKWGYTREYVSQIERGKRKLDHTDQVARLADILDIPQERLEAIGRSIPQRSAVAHRLAEADDVLLQTLLEPAKATVKLSWLVWYANSDTTIIDHLAQLIVKLEDAITNRRGTLLMPAMELLVYAHEMQGKIAFDRLEYTTANGHFQEMHDLGQELKNPDIIALSMIHQGDLQRRRGRFDAAIRTLAAAQSFADNGSLTTSGMRWQTLARAYAEYGQKSAFLAAIDRAESAARAIAPSLDTTSNQFELVEVVQERAQGYTLLWEPQHALALYDESERLKPFRPMRDLGVLLILQAQAHAYAGDVDQGVQLAIRGLQLARAYHSSRHVSRVQRMYDRLSVTKLGQAPAMQTLREALHH